MLFVEDFETGTVEEIGARWGNITKKENVRLTGDLHHFVALVADRTPTPWPRPGAGEIPPGDAQFSTAIEPTASKPLGSTASFTGVLTASAGGPVTS